MKKLLVVSAVAALGLASIASAGGLPQQMPMAPAASSEMGVYFGLSGGFGMTGWKDIAEGAGDYVSNSNGVAARAFIGLDINRYFAVETGYTHFFNKVKGKGEDEGARTGAIDLMGKGKLPVVENFDLYTKLGLSYLSTIPKEADSKNNLNLAFGAGADYSITPNLIANIEWLRFNGNGKIGNDNYQPHADVFLAGLRYKIDL